MFRCTPLVGWGEQFALATNNEQRHKNQIVSHLQIATQFMINDGK